MLLQISKAREDSIRKQAEGIVAFETKLANITIPRAQRRNESELYHNMTIGTLQVITSRSQEDEQGILNSILIYTALTSSTWPDS